MVRIRYSSYRKLINEALKNKAEFVFGKMNGNPAYAAYQSQVTELGGYFAPFTVAIANFKLGGSDRKDIRDKNQTDIVLTLDGIGRQLEAEANAKGVAQDVGEALIKNAGFDIIEAKAATPKKIVTFLDAPTGLRAIDEKKHGSVTLEWIEDDNANTYVILDVDADGHIHIAGVSDASPVVLSGFPANAKRTFCIFSIADGTVMSDRSEMVTVWIS